jgi:misacylated tRNA(Ala) deacylase
MKQRKLICNLAGGTHVERTGEIGAIRLGKIEKKGKINRRVYVHLAD